MYKKFTIYLFLILLFCSCTHKVFRSNYKFGVSEKTENEIVIGKKMSNTDSILKLGDIKLSDGWWVLSCSEKLALKILKKEARLLGADLINIIKEQRPGFKSTCYQCEAEFYKLADFNNTVKSDSLYTSENIEKRSIKDKRRNVIAIATLSLIGFGIGFFIGFLLIQ